MKQPVLALIILFVATFCHAQKLPRRASLGVGFYSEIPDSLKPAIDKLNSPGVLIKFVAPQSTAEALKLTAGDYITQLNGTAVNSAAALVSEARKLRTGEKIAVSCFRNGKLLELKGIVKGKPLETLAEAKFVYGEYPFDNGMIRTILRLPANGKPKGCVYFIHGISCYSLDNMAADDPTKLMLDGIVQNGYAVFVTEKAGLGDSDSPVPCKEMGFDKELLLFETAYKFMLTIPEVKGLPVFVFGHSLGGIIAPILASGFQPNGVMVFGTVLQPWYDYLLEAIGTQSVWEGADRATLRDSMEWMKPAMQELFYSGKTASEVLASDYNMKAITYAMGYDKSTGLVLAGRTPDYHRELNKHNVAEAWKNYRGKVLTMFGEGDVAAMKPDDHIAIVEYANALRPGSATYAYFESTNHTFQKTGTIASYYEMQKEPGKYDALARISFNAEILNKVVSWMGSVLALQGVQK